MIWRQIWHLLVESDISPERTTERTMKSEYLNSLNLSGLLKHELKLKKNTVVILLFLSPLLAIDSVLVTLKIYQISIRYLPD